MQSHHHQSSRPHTPAQGAFTLLIPELQHAGSDRGYHTPTPIQEQAIGHLLHGRDLIGCAQTGTGKGNSGDTLLNCEITIMSPGFLKKEAKKGLPVVINF
jgi:hypothetical protein